MANLLPSVMGAFAEFERALIRARQLEGIELVKRRGVYRGRHRSLDPEAQVQLFRVSGRFGGDAGASLAA
jgi:DNA invertase Pin-like site-specific DNA recombinase